MKGSRFPLSALWSLVALAATLAVGCARCPDTFVPIEQLLGEYNANASAVPRLWAMAKVSITFSDGPLPFTWGSTSPLAAPNALLLLGKQAGGEGEADFLLRGSESGIELFRVGASNTDGVYYFWYKLGERAGAWYGQNALAGAPGAAGLPIDPHQLLAVLSVCELPDDLTSLPAAVLRMHAEPGRCAYVVSLLDRQPITGKILFRREMLFNWDRDEELPRRPFRINFFDAAGQLVMTANLKDYKAVEAPGVANAPPVMPTNIEIVWPARKSRIRIVLSNMTTREEGKGDPAAASRFWKNLPGGIDPVRVDPSAPAGGAGR